MPSYRIKHHPDEFACPTCGVPCYVGDTAWQEGPDGPVYCSAHCAGHRPNHGDSRNRRIRRKNGPELYRDE